MVTPSFDIVEFPLHLALTSTPRKPVNRLIETSDSLVIHNLTGNTMKSRAVKLAATKARNSQLRSIGLLASGFACALAIGVSTN